MKLWLLRPIEGHSEAWKPWYDKAFGFVVRAETEELARTLANDMGGAEVGKISHNVYRTGGDPWLDPEQSSCIELTVLGPQDIIIRDFARA